MLGSAAPARPDAGVDRIAVALCVVAFLARAGFLLVAARPYFGRANVYVDGDTAAWTAAFVNLIARGEFTTNADSPFGPFGRMPAYSFVIGFFYVLAGGDLGRAYPLLAWAQIAVDSGCVYLMYRIAAKAYGDPRAGLGAAALYALYPFVIVWTPVAYSEALGVAAMIAGLHFFVRSDAARSSAASGALLGLAGLLRPQLLVLAGVMGAWLALRRHPRRLAAFALGVALTYGIWPLRNYVSYGRIVPTQDLRAFPNWSPDVLAFMQYTYSVKAEWEPQFTQLVTNRKVEFPPAAFAVPGDAPKLERALRLAQTCASGFTYWKTSVRPPLRGPNCNDDVAALFEELRASQYRHNRLNALPEGASAKPHQGDVQDDPHRFDDAGPQARQRPFRLSHGADPRRTGGRDAHPPPRTRSHRSDVDRGRVFRGLVRPALRGHAAAAAEHRDAVFPARRRPLAPAGGRLRRAPLSP